MRTRIAPTVVLALGAVLASPIAAQAAEITVWEHEDFRGASTVLDRASSRLENGWNDRISSFRVQSGEWELCRDWDFGSCRIVGPGTEQARLESGWNDAISSLRPVSAAVSPANAETTAQRLYSALLGRDADAEGLRNAAAQIRAGKLSGLVTGMIQSQEFRTLSQQKSPTELLDQIYRGLFGRPADTAARTAYVSRIQRGDVNGVVLDLVASEEFGSGGTVASTPSNQTSMQGDEVRANGTGVVIWGGKKYFDTVSAARVQLGDNGRIRISLTGSSPQTLDGTYTRESADSFRVDTIDVPERGSVHVNGGVTLDHNQLARIDVSSGTQGTRDRVVYTFVAKDYQLPRDESLCQEEIRARLQSKGHAADKLAFLAPERSRASSNRYQLSGEVVMLSDNTSAQYSCEVDSRNNRLLDAKIVGMQ